METVDVLMKMPKIDGYEYTGEWRIPEIGEEYTCSVACKPTSIGYSSSVARPILRKAEVWKPLTLEKALEMGKTRKKFKFRMYPYAVKIAPTSFEDTVDYIDLNPDTRSNLRFGYYGWAASSDVEYLET